jgi:3-hydroxymyristoyl/3-hydroxydecanoyl-(acyl carrier protein) dehydratase/NAD(P)-dependent dehydrogenase (short-subunit alcohol dehydrogenase family)
MFQGKNILIVGAREGGYGASIGRAFIRAGARVLGTSLDPQNPRENIFFKETGMELLSTPLKFDIDRRDMVFESLRNISTEIESAGISRLDAVVHTVAGGFPRQPSVMKAVGDILKGKQTFNDMATLVKRNVYYVNAGSFSDLAEGLKDLVGSDTHLVALTYRGDLPYFISDTKAYLERLATRLARLGKRTLIAALPEAWTQSSQFFTGIELAVVYHYLTELKPVGEFRGDIRALNETMRKELSQLEGFDKLVSRIDFRLRTRWKSIVETANVLELNKFVGEFFGEMRSDSSFSTLRRAVEIISDFVRETSGIVLVNNLLSPGNYSSGDVRQVRYNDLGGATVIGLAAARKSNFRVAPKINKWVTYEKTEIAETLNMYGANFLFLDRVIMEEGELREGMLGFARFKVPTPEQNPLLRDHFVNMPMFGGHLQMEAVAQFAAFMVLRLLKNRKMIPILTGTAFPDLNTMAPPGEVLTIVGRINMRDKRDLVLEAFIENRFARTYGTIKGMVLNERLVKKMLSSFNLGESNLD